MSDATMYMMAFTLALLFGFQSRQLLLNIRGAKAVGEERRAARMTALVACCASGLLTVAAASAFI
jgi:fatty acid desaturase